MPIAGGRSLPLPVGLMGELDWRVYYGDGSTFSSEDGPPEDAPPLGVQAVICQRELWGCGDIFGLFDYLMSPGRYKVVRFGRLVSNAAYQAAVEAARKDPCCGPDRVVCERGDYYWWNGEG